MRTLLRSLALVFMFIISQGCATIDVTPSMINLEHGYWVDKQFVKYLTSFKKDSKGKVKRLNTHVVFGDLSYSTGEDKSNTIGLCNFFTRRITIDRGWWEEHSSVLKREELIYHELGHCLLFRGHTALKKCDGSISYYIDKTLISLGIVEEKGYLEDGCPKSYMHPYSLKLDCIAKHRKYYIKEMFGSSDERIINEEINQAYSQVFKGACPKTIKENKSGEPWNNTDENNMLYAKKRCPKVTGLPCLKKFTKKEPQVYWAICGH